MLGAPIYPSGEVEHLEWSPVELEVYRGTVEMVVPFTVTAGHDDPVRIAGTLRYQGCTDTTCLPPVVVPIEAAAPGTATP